MAHHPTDRLSTLSSQILSLIFEQVRLEGHDWSPISKSLLPYTNAGLYHSVTFTQPDKLELFVRTVGIPSDGESGTSTEHRRKELASLVKSFTVSPSEKLGPTSEWKNVDPEALFKALSRVTEISIANCHPLTTALASSTKIQLPSLKRLTLKGTMAQDDVPLMMGRFNHLSAFYALQSLELAFSSSDTDSDSEEESTLPPISNLPKGFHVPVKTLKVDVDGLKTTSDSVATFLSHFKSLESLTILNYLHDLNFDIALKKAPKSLKYLSLSRPDFDPDEDDNLPPLGKVLSQFPVLHSLHLDRSFFTEEDLASTRYCKVLQKLKLSCDDRNGRLIPTLVSLIISTTRPPKLTNLFIDVLPVTVLLGWSRLLSRVPLLDDEDGFPTIDFGQRYRFIKAAAKLGIRVRGNLMEENIVVIHNGQEFRKSTAEHSEDDSEEDWREGSEDSEDSEVA